MDKPRRLSASLGSPSKTQKSKRKATPPQTLFSNYRIAHSTILSRHGNDNPSLYQPPQLPGFTESVLLSRCKDRQSARICLGDCDTGAKQMKPQPIEVVVDCSKFKRPRSLSKIRRNSMSEDISDTEEELQVCQPDAENAPVSRRKHMTQLHRHSRSFDSLLCKSSDMTPYMLHMNGAESAAISSVDVPNLEVNPDREMPELLLPPEVMTEFGFIDISKKELKHCPISANPHHFTKKTARQALVVKGFDSLENNPSMQHDQITNQLNIKENRENSSGSASPDLSSSRSIFVTGKKDLEGERLLCLRTGQKSNVVTESNVQVAQPHVSLNNVALSLSSEVGNAETEQEWETIRESEQSSRFTTISDLSKVVPHSRASGTKHTPDIFSEPRSHLPRSPLRPVKAVLNLPALVHKAGPEPERSIATVKHQNEPRFQAPQGPNPLTTALSFSPTANQVSSSHSPVLISQPRGQNQTSSCQISFLHKFQPSPVLQSSSLFPFDNIPTLEMYASDCDTSEQSGPLQMDKGKGKAIDWNHPASGSDNYHSSTSESHQNASPKLRYDDLFEDIIEPHDEYNRIDTRCVLSPAIKSLPSGIIPLITQNMSKIAKAEPNNADRSSSQCSDDGSYNSKLSKIASKYDPDVDADISAFLRATAHIKTTDMPSDLNQSRDVCRKQGDTTSYHDRAPLIKDTQSNTNNTDAKDVIGTQKKCSATMPRGDTRATFEGRLGQIQTHSESPSGPHGRPSLTVEGSRKSQGFGADAFTGVALSNGDRISKAQRLIVYEDNWVTRLSPLQEAVATEMAIRMRFDIVNDDWNRLKHECPQFPLREEHLAIPHPVKEGCMKNERLEKLENGEWLERAYCKTHKRSEFSATKGLGRRRLDPALVQQQHAAGRLAIVLGCILFPFGGFKILLDLYNDDGCAADLMRESSRNGLIDQPHENERRLAGLMIEVMAFVWFAVAAVILGLCIKYFI